MIIQTMYHSLYFILSGLCDYLVFVNKWFVWRHGLCEGMSSVLHPSHKPSLHTNHLSCMGCITYPFTQTIPSLKPSLHTNHSSFSVLHIFWFVWRDVIQRMINGVCDYLVCVAVLQRMINGLDLSGLCDYLICVLIWIVWL